MVAHETALIIARMNFLCTLQAFGVHQLTAALNRVDLNDDYRNNRCIFKFKNHSKIFLYHEFIDIECKTDADCNKLSNTEGRICQTGRCLRNKMIIQSYF